ncbi:carboxypeptidase-like regulatory domain-containing protein [uncultured Muribaculum sp.]|uniref:carboxypeptidase-like regulatory domain-containing protein n=1 Tax=uncultured Muribaculum sp. TaxID=1918613 RepID=UPI00262020F8|nr:carboxypeptidase-like regulatory domain-containing protein [uncultured Muribaculum sp.]
MARGKQTCKILKEIRRQIAEANGIEFITSECRYKGDCLGTCPKCEAEVRYLEQQLRIRSLAGKAVALAGISAASLAMLMPMTSQAQTLQEPQNILKGSIPVMADTITVRGVALSGDTLPDGTISKEPLIGATILNKRTALGAITDLDGHFGLTACLGDTLKVEYVGYEPLEIIVTENMRNVEITLTPSQAFLGEVVFAGAMPARKENHYLDLNVTDEKGNVIVPEDINIERIWFDEDGDEYSEYISSDYFDDKHPCRIYWDYQSGLQNEDGKPLKETTLRIEAEGYDDPIIITVKYPKRNAKKTIKFKHRKQK